MRLCLLLLAPLLFSCLILRSAPGGQKKDDPTKHSGPIEIDFAPIAVPAVKHQYQLAIWLKPESGDEYREVITADPGISAKDFQMIVKSSVESVGWKTHEVGDTKLLIEKYKKGELHDYKIVAEFTDKKIRQKMPQPKTRRLREDNAEKK